MSRDTADRNAAIYQEFMRRTASGGYTSPKALHTALGIQFSPDKPLSHNTIRKIIGRQGRAGAQHPAPSEDAPLAIMPPGQRLKGVSTLVDEQGNIRVQWIKTDRKQQQWLDIVNGVLERIPTLFTPLPPVRQSDAPVNDMLALYPLADLHVGLYASLMDAERDWHLADAVKMVKTCIDDLVSRTPTAARAIVANLGDFTHTDNLINRTPNSGAALDASGRFIEIAQAAMELAVYVINSVARHHQQVTVVWQSGNHDESTALVMQSALALMYHDDERIRVHVSGKRAHVIRHGQVALGFSHGDTAPRKSLPMIMANDYPAIWAATRYRVWHVGHYHHRNILDEQVGCFVETHETPAPGDAYSNRMGYRSLHSMCSIVYDTIGEYSRNTVQVRPPPPRDEERKPIDAGERFRPDDESEVTQGLEKSA